MFCPLHVCQWGGQKVQHNTPLAMTSVINVLLNLHISDNVTKSGRAFVLDCVRLSTNKPLSTSFLPLLVSSHAHSFKCICPRFRKSVSEISAALNMSQ